MCAKKYISSKYFLLLLPDDIIKLQEFAIGSDELQEEFINSLDSNDELYEEGRSEEELESLLQERISKYTNCSNEDCYQTGN